MSSARLHAAEVARAGVPTVMMFPPDEVWEIKSRLRHATSAGESV